MVKAQSAQLSAGDHVYQVNCFALLGRCYVFGVDALLLLLRTLDQW
jgi:hypothetical protein